MYIIFILFMLVTNKVFAKIKQEFYGVGDYNYICHVTDRFSKYHILFPLQSKSAVDVALKNRTASLCVLWCSANFSQ